MTKMQTAEPPVDVETMEVAIRALRCRPRQARSQRTFDAILKTAAELLVEVGWDGFNTNLLAERAGVTVPAVYRYFPNKLAVVSTLAEVILAQWGALFVDFDQRMRRTPDPVAVWIEYMDRFVDFLRERPSALALRRAMRASPELARLDREDSERLAALLARSLQRPCPGLEPQQYRGAARMLIESALAVIDVALEAGNDEAAQLLAQLKTMQAAYLRQLATGRIRA